MEIVTDNPIVINRKKKILSLPHRGQQHPLGKKLTLLAFSPIYSKSIYELSLRVRFP
jgi:hypothetical protein